MTQDWSGHSGSRWEPLPGPERGEAPGSSMMWTGLEPDHELARPRRRGPVIALLVALMAIGSPS